MRHGFHNTGLSAGVRRGHVRIGEILAERRAAEGRMPKRVRELCPCSLPREDGHIVCLCCWKAAPSEFKRDLMRSNPINVRMAASASLLRFARNRKPATPIR